MNPRDRRTIFDPTDFDPEMRKDDMTTATKKRTRKSKKPESNPPTSIAPDDENDTAKAEVDAAMADLRNKLEATEKKLKSFDGWTKKLRAAMERVRTCRAEFEQADAARKEAKAAVDSAVAKVLELDAKIANGEQLLPFDPTDDEKPTETAAAPATPAPPADDHGAKQPIESLLAKNIKKIVGKDVFDDAKSKDQAIGLSDKQLEIIVAADIKTIGDLEKRISADAWFLKNLKGFGEKAIDRLTDTLLAFRAVYPIPPESETPAPSQPPIESASPSDPQPEEWEQSAYHLRELIAAANSLLETEITEDGKQFCRSVAMDAEDMLIGIEVKKAVTKDQKDAIESWTNGVAKWRKPSN